MSYQVGQIFMDEYPTEVADFCNNSNKYHISELEKIDGHRRFQIQELQVPTYTVEELAAFLRAERSRRLSDCDFRMCADVLDSMTDEQNAAWRAYRQALRDITSLEGFPWDGGGPLTPWPEKPE